MSIFGMIKPSFFSAFMFYWFYLILLIQICSTEKIRVPDFTFRIMKDFSVPTPFNWLSVPQPTMYQCSQFCYSFKICKAFNFDKVEDLCELHLATAGELGMLVKPKLNDYLERQDISKELVGKCWNHDCDVYSKCSEINGRATCVQVFEGRTCGHPFPFTFANTTLESPALPGSTVNFICTPPYNGTFKMMCSIDGSWAYYLYPHNYCLVDFCDMSFIWQTREIDIFITTKDRRFFFTQFYCETGFDGDDWLILQRRYNTSLDFDTYVYVYGIHDHHMDVWIGTRKLFLLTDYYELDLRVEFKVENDSTLYHAMYERFYVDTNSTDYRLTIGQYTGGNCGDGLSYMDGFTFNITMDGWGGWWDRDGCNGTNLNAKERSGALKWATDCHGNTRSMWTDIVFTKMTVRLKKT